MRAEAAALTIIRLLLVWVVRAVAVMLADPPRLLARPEPTAWAVAEVEAIVVPQQVPTAVRAAPAS
jgi:hypothetical protein